MTDVAFGKNSHPKNDDNGSHIVPFSFGNASSSVLDTGRKISEESASSSTALLRTHTKQELDRNRKSSCESDISSGYINLNDTQNGSGMVSSASILPADNYAYEETAFNDPSLREEMSPISCGQSPGNCPVEESLRSPSPSGIFPDGDSLSTDVHAVNPSSESTNESILHNKNEDRQLVSIKQNSSFVTEQKHQDKDSGFSYGTGYAMSSGNCGMEPDSTKDNTDSSSSPTGHLKDSGCPVQDSGHLLVEETSSHTRVLTHHSSPALEKDFSNPCLHQISHV